MVHVCDKLKTYTLHLLQRLGGNKWCSTAFWNPYRAFLSRSSQLMNSNTGRSWQSINQLLVVRVPSDFVNPTSIGAKGKQNYLTLCCCHHNVDALHLELIRADLIRTLAEMSRLSFGNANMPKVCLQALVRLISTMDDDDDAQWYLTELLDYDIVLLIATYIRSGKCERDVRSVFYTFTPGIS